MLNLLALDSRKITTRLKAERAIRKASQNSLAKKVLGKLTRFGGWAIGAFLSAFPIDFDRIWDMAIDAYFTLKEFDWNATDKELRQQIDANNQTIAVAGSRAFGRQVGIGAVRLVTAFAGRFAPGKRGGALRAAQGIKIPVLSKKIALALAEDQKNELRNDTINFLETASRAMMSNAMINAVLFTRNFELFGMKPITQDIEAEGSLVAKVDRQVKKLPKAWQAPVSAFLDGVEDGIIDAGYVVAGVLDDEVAAMRYVTDEKAQGPTITVEAKMPDGEKMTFVGTQDQVQEAMDTALPLAPLIAEEKTVAMPATWLLKPGAERSQLAITYRAETENRSTHTLHIPHYEGTQSPSFPDYETGDWMGLWTLADGSKLTIYAATEREAAIMMRSMARFVPARFRTGRPRYFPTDRRIRRKKVRWIAATYYPQGLSAPSSWKSYRNLGGS